MQEPLDFLLYDIGVELVFCLPPQDCARICATEFWDADSFTQEFFRVEGINPDEHLNWKREIHNRFTDMFGSSSVDTESFRQERQCKP